MTSLKFVIVLLVVFCFLPAQSKQRSVKHQSKTKKILKHLRRNFILVRKFFAINSLPLRRQTRDVISGSQSESADCKWKWVKVEETNRTIPTLVQAQCIGKCAFHCKPIFYGIKVLIKKGKHLKSGIELWAWKTKRIVIGYENKTN